MILNLPCLEAAENQRNEDSEGLFFTSTFGGVVQTGLMHVCRGWRCKRSEKFDFHWKGRHRHGGGDGMRKIKTKEGCVFERVMGGFRVLNIEVRGHCFL